jgi:iron complex outermembrane recepter protein
MDWQYRHGRTLELAALALLAASSAARAQENPATQLDMPTVEIIGTTPLPGIGLPPEQIPANVQSISAERIGRSRAVDLAGVLSRTLGSANTSDTQGNPFQTDLNFRGFTASPVLGTPQGLSVFVDGVRANQALGDTVDWDLIARNAIARISVIPGSNPVFGLNTLGAAVAVTTKSGFEFPGTSFDATAGSFGRRSVEFETGGHGRTVDYFLAANLFEQSGWSQRSPSRVQQLFAKTGYQDARTDVDLSFAFADNRLEGSQTLPRSWLDTPSQDYSWPDIQTNRIALFNLKASRYLDDKLLLGADVYDRYVSTTVFNSNVNGNFVPLPTPVGACSPASGGSPFPLVPPGACNWPAQNALNGIAERRPGASIQLTYLGALAGHKNTLAAGASIDRGNVDFTQFNQYALVSADRGTVSNLPATPSTSLKSTNTYEGLYATDSFEVDSRTFLTLSGRYNRALVELDDQLGTALNGHHRFSRFNPATGLNFNLSPALTTYVAYNEGMRAPTAVELTCADPNAPCSLPNAFSSDPDLKPVISRTYELGARGRAGGAKWRVSGYDTRLSDDIQFISSRGGSVSAGYFQNVGQTRRRGFETGIEARAGGLSLEAQYSFIDATYGSSLILDSPANSTAAPLTCPTCTDIAVAPGDRIPGIPRHLLKLGITWDWLDKWSFGARLSGQSGVYARGDENNRDVNGPLPGFFTVSLEGRYRPAARWELALRVDNLFDRTCSTYGQLGQNAFGGPGRSFVPDPSLWNNEQFRSLAAPRGVWLVVSFSTAGDQD